MKKSALILGLSIIVFSCSKKETDTQTNNTDTLSTDTMVPQTMETGQDTLPMPPTTDTASTTTMPADTATTNR